LKEVVKNKDLTPLLFSLLFFYPNSFDSVKDLIYNLGNFLFEYNHLRRHGGLAYITPHEKLEKVTELLS
jgi:transposase InsO family protein